MRDPERLAWFEREAQLLASLNHPNIAAIHGLEEANGIRYLILEQASGLEAEFPAAFEARPRSFPKAHRMGQDRG